MQLCNLPIPCLRHRPSRSVPPFMTLGEQCHFTGLQKNFAHFPGSLAGGADFRLCQRGLLGGLYPLLSLRPNVVRADLESRRAAAECWSCKLYSSFSYSTIHFLCLIHKVFDNIVLVTYICPSSSIRVIIRGTNVTCTLQLSSAARCG